METKQIVSRFKNPRRQRDGSFMCSCPCHDDRKQSLHISHKGNKTLICDQAGCSLDEILEAVGLKQSDLFDDEIQKSSRTWRDRMEYGQKQKHGEGAHIAAVYNYKDANGKYLFSKIRIEGGDIQGKEFLQARIDDSSDSYQYGLGGIKPTLYNLPALIRAIDDGFPVYIVEGEKDVETLRKLHYTATTAGAVGGWKKEYAKHFIGATVNILPDNDKPGETLAEEIRRDLKPYAFTVRVIHKISSIQKGDITDFFEKEGGTLEAFKSRVQNTEGIIAPWAYLNSRDEVNIKPSQLAVSFSKVMDYIIVRNPLDDNDLFYGFEGGVYRRKNKAQIKSSLRKFVPVAYQKDAQIAEAQRTLFELGTKIHSFDDLDANERYINFKNGLLDLRQWELVPHDSEVISTIQLQFDYDPTIKDKPVFDRYINDLFTREDGEIDHDSMKILQEFCGLAISNIYVYRAKKALFLCSIRGNTGKTQLLNLVQLILGEENATSIPIQHMNENTGRFTMGTALGKRMIINGDQTESDIGDSSYFKQLTGGDRTKMESKNKQPLMVRYRGGIMVGCNGLPSFTDDKGEHVFERLLLIMCTNVIPEEKRDAALLDKMKPEIPAIINWFLEGLKRLIANGYKFTRSKSAEDAVKEYRQRLDSVYRFINEWNGSVAVGNEKTSSNVYGYTEHFEITKNRADQYPKNTFYDSYTAWCEDPDIDLTPIKKKNLNQRLEALGLEVDPRGVYKDRHGIYTIRGLKKTYTKLGDIDSRLTFSGEKSPPAWEDATEESTPWD